VDATGRRAEVVAILLLTAVAMIGLPVATQLTAVIGFIIGLPISGWTLPTAIIVTAAVVVLAARRSLPDRGLSVAAGVIALQLGALALGVTTIGATYDLSFDGQWFNQEAVLVLDSGWNPLREPAPVDVALEKGARSRVDGYVKGSWVSSAAIFALTGRIEHGKVFDVLLILGATAAAAAAAACIPTVPLLGALVFGLLAALNPTTLNQLSTQMTDGDLACGLLVLAAGLAAMLLGPSPRLAALVASLGIVSSFGSKMSGPPMAALVLIAGLLTALAIDRRQVTRGMVAAMIAAGVVSAIANLNPLATNWMWFGHPLYPYYGDSKTDAGFAEEKQSGGLDALAVSAFSIPSGGSNAGASLRSMMKGERFRKPFLVSRRDFVTMRMPGQHVGGWGPLFGGMILIGLSVLLLEVRRRPMTVLAVAAVCSTLIASTLILHYPWIARYAPQVWWVPLLTLPVALSSPRRWTRGLGIALAAVAAVNTVPVLALHLIQSAKGTEMVRGVFLELRENDPEPDVCFGVLRSNRQRMAELGIRARETSDPERHIGILLGRTRPRLMGSLVRFREAHSGPRVVARWRPDRWAKDHELRLTPVDPPTGDTAPIVRNYDRTVFRAVFDGVPPGRWLVSIRACNALGCGPADTKEITVPAEASATDG
jgi:hypothetical protein